MEHEQNTVRILGPDNRQVGTGILIGPTHILTCTHVVAAAQGRPDADTAALGQGISVELPLLAAPVGGPLHALPQLCKPVLAQPRVGDLADIALLRLDDPARLPSDAAPVALHVLSQPYKREAAAFGFNRWDGDTVRLNLLAMNASGAVQIEQRPDYPEVGPGFSGAAVRDVADWSVIGMLVRRDRPDPRGQQARTVYMIPAAQLQRVLDEAGVADRTQGKPETAPATASPAAPDERLLWTETVRLLTDCLAHQEPKALRDNAFRHLPNDPSRRLRTDGAPSDLAVAWARELWEAKCMDGHSPLSRLLAEGYASKRPPAVHGLGDLQALRRALDAPCRGDSQPIPADNLGSAPTSQPRKPCRTPEAPDRPGTPVSVGAQGATENSHPAGQAGAMQGQAVGGAGQPSHQAPPEHKEAPAPVTSGEQGGWRRPRSPALWALLLALALLAAALLYYLRPWEPASSGASLSADPPATTQSGPPSEPPLTLAVNQLGATDADVTVNVIQKDAAGQYSRLLGATGTVPVMHTGDRYRIHIAARRDAWLYIVHFDSDGAWRMPLFKDRGGDPGDQRQHLRAGERIILPGSFTNDRRDSYVLKPLKSARGDGTEAFHFVLSTRPVQGLQAAYRAALGRDPETRSGQAASGSDPETSERSAVMRQALEDIPPASRLGRPEPDPDAGPDGASAAIPLLECQAPHTGCSAQLLIRHLPKAQP